ncbi:MAG: 2'-deoxycytidine 5'-triphosphate deaminase domain-containing protein [Enterocloster clostridioformis]
MILSDGTLFKMLEEGTLSITPLDKEQVQPASVDIRLGDTFSIVEDLSTGIITLKDEVRYKTINTDTYILLPGQFVLATTMEYVSLPDNLTAFVEGEVLWDVWACLYRMRAGWIRAFRGRLLLNYSMLTAVPLS